MKEEISKVVQDSIQFGTTIPENMRPWIEKLAAAGDLVDANGVKITDFSRLQFGTTLESEMDKFVRKLGELIDKLAGVKAGFNGAQGAAADFNAEAGNTPSGPNVPGSGTDGGPIMPSRGGIVGKHGELRYLSEGGFVPRGTDTVPAMLSPGEMVTPADVTTEIVKSVKDRRNPGDVHILPIFLDGRASDREMVDEVFRQLPRRIAGNDSNSRTALQRVIGANRVH